MRHDIANFGRWRARGVLAVLMTGVATGALAQTSAADRDARIQALEAQVQALAAQIAELKNATAAADNQIIDLKTSAAAQGHGPSATQAATIVSLANGRPTIATGDGQFTASLHGVFQLDAALYDQDRPGPLATDNRRGSFNDALENGHARDLSDGANFRRARLGIEGKAFGAFDYNFLYDFGGSGVEDSGRISSAWVQYAFAGATPVRLRVGAYGPVSGLEDAASSSSSLFPERPSVVEVVRGIAGGDGRTAIGLSANGERWSLGGALTGNVVGAQTFDEQLGFIGRATYAPFKGADWTTHVGVNANLVLEPAAGGPDVPGGADRNVRLRDRPELRVDPTRLVDTGNIDADGVRAIGIEGAAQRKNLFLQGEYFKIDIERRASALPDPGFSGWYVQGGWIITGGVRRYSSANAGFNGPRVARPFDLKKGQWGEIELAWRYSYLDLNDNEGSGPLLPLGAVRGGEQTIWSLGANWYLNEVVALEAAYRKVSVDRLSPGGGAFLAGSTPAPGALVGQDLNIWSVRTQYSF